MSAPYSAKDKVILALLTVGVFCFGLILPDSTSDHVKLVHFSAHFGMSFLLALCFYMFCTVRLHISKIFSYTILISATLIIGVLYKSWEIATEDLLSRFSFPEMIKQTGALTSMSQNISGVLAAMLFIEGLVHRNLIISIIKPGHFRAPLSPLKENISGSISFSSLIRNERQAGMPVGSQFSPNSSEK